MKRSLRRLILEDWRGLPQPDIRPDRLVSVREVLVQLAPKLGLEKRLREEEISLAWSEIVGDFFAAHSQPARLIDGTLSVHVLQPTILYELDRRWKPLVLEKLRQRFGAKVIRDVRFRLG